MQKSVKRFTIACAFLCFTCSLVVAEELADMSLENLLNMKVTVASKKAETLSEAAAVISVVTAQDIEAYGALNVYEVLDRVTSIYMTSSGLYRYEPISMRGDLSSHYDVHTLILINGRPHRSSYSGGYDTNVLAAMPVSAIERIEVIRGPGSVLYGSGAYTGVINIILKKSGEAGEVSAQAGGGTFNTVQGGVTVAKATKDVNAYSAVNYLESVGWKFKAKDEPGVGYAGQDSSADWGQRNVGFIFNGEYKGFTLATLLSQSKNTMLGPNNRWPSQILESINYWVDLGYQHQISGTWKTNLNLTYNYQALDFPQDIPGTTIYEKSNSRDLLTEANVSGQIIKDLNVIVGGTYDAQTNPNDSLGLPGVFTVPDYATNWWSWYLQADYKIIPSLKVVVGEQYNKVPNIDGDYVPRAGLVYNLNANWGAKALYGQAFRSPYRVETIINVPGTLVGNSTNLLPEKITTYDFNIFYKAEKAQVGLTYFQSKQKNLITRVTVAGVGTYTNVGEQDSQGLEFESTVLPMKNLSVTGNYTYQKNWNQDNVENVTLMPTHMIKTGVTYMCPCGISAGVFDSYYSARYDDIIVKPTRVVLNPNADAYGWLSANILFDLNKLCKLTWKQKVQLKLYGENLLDANVYDPEFNRKNINTLPTRSGRLVMGEVKVTF